MIAFALCTVTSASNAATIIKLNLGETGPDVALDQTGMFGTTNDGNAATTGNQNTAIEYTDGLDFIPDISTNIGSFSLNSLLAVGPAQRSVHLRCRISSADAQFGCYCKQSLALGITRP